MKWRIVKDDRSDQPLPGPAGELGFCLTGDHIQVFFMTKEFTSYGTARSIEIDPVGRLTVGRADGRPTVYAPASTTKRNLVPVPPFSLSTFAKYQYNDDCAHAPTRHAVEEVNEPPDPNRWGNKKDALVTAKCGYHGWVQPKHMEPTAQMPDCPTCFPRSSR